MNTAYDPPKTDVHTDTETFDPPLLSATGRMGRLRYLAHSMWMTLVAYLIIGGVGGVLAALVNEGLGYTVAIAGALGILAIQFILTIKRCHDFNAAGWWSILVLVPFVGLVYALIPGTKGANRFGARPSENPVGVIIGACLPLLVFPGILAGIAIPAYQDYTQRAQIGEAFATTSGAKTAIAQFAQTTQTGPSAGDLQGMELGHIVPGQYSSFRVEPDSGVIVVTMNTDGSAGPDIAGGRIVFTPNIDSGTFQFLCSSDTISAKFLPSRCESSAVSPY